MIPFDSALLGECAIRCSMGDVQQKTFQFVTKSISLQQKNKYVDCGYQS